MSRTLPTCCCGALARVPLTLFYSGSGWSEWTRTHVPCGSILFKHGPYGGNLAQMQPHDPTLSLPQWHACRALNPDEYWQSWTDAAGGTHRRVVPTAPIGGGSPVESTLARLFWDGDDLILQADWDIALRHEPRMSQDELNLPVSFSTADACCYGPLSIPTSIPHNIRYADLFEYSMAVATPPDADNCYADQLMFETGYGKAQFTMRVKNARDIPLSAIYRAYEDLGVFLGYLQTHVREASLTVNIPNIGYSGWNVGGDTFIESESVTYLSGLFNFTKNPGEVSNFRVLHDYPPHDEAQVGCPVWPDDGYCVYYCDNYSYVGAADENKDFKVYEVAF